MAEPEFAALPRRSRGRASSPGIRVSGGARESAAQPATPSDDARQPQPAWSSGAARVALRLATAWLLFELLWMTPTCTYLVCLGAGLAAALPRLNRIWDLRSGAQLKLSEHAQLFALTLVQWSCWSGAASLGLPLLPQLWPGIGLFGRGNRRGWPELTVAMVCLWFFFRPPPCFAGSSKTLTCKYGGNYTITSDSWWPSCSGLGGTSKCPSHFPYMCEDMACQQWPSECETQEHGGLRACRAADVLGTNLLLCCLAALALGIAGYFFQLLLKKVQDLGDAAVQEQLLVTNIAVGLVFVPLFWQQIELLLERWFACDCNTLYLFGLIALYIFMEHLVLRYDAAEGAAVEVPRVGNQRATWTMVGPPLAALLCSIGTAYFGPRAALAGVLVPAGCFTWSCQQGRMRKEAKAVR